MLKIRLTRVGKKNSPAFRVVVADRRKAVKREFIEILGHYNPISKPKQIVIDKERSLHWIKLGAQPSDTVNNLMCDLGILPKNKKINKVYAKKKEETAEKTEEQKPETEAPTEEEVAAPAEETAAETNTEEAKEVVAPVEEAEKEETAEETKE
jgi:small subunit ribosomal protein S16